jgi:hypothetical protein
MSGGWKRAKHAEDVRSMEGLAGWWTLELNNVPFRVGEIDGGTFSLGSIAHLN